MRAVFGLGLLFALTVLAVHPQQAVAQNVRVKWVYADNSGQFVAEGEQKWRQTDKDGGNVEFVQIAETRDYIELKSVRGDYIARLYKDQYQVKKAEAQRFEFYCKGRWVRR